MKKTLTKAIFLVFSNSSNATANISIPFTVKTIKCKSIAYAPQNNPVRASYGILTSTIVENQPLGIFYDDITNPYSFMEVIFDLNSPTNISGEYTFTILDESGDPTGTVGGATDKCIVILEFSSDDM